MCVRIIYRNITRACALICRLHWETLSSSGHTNTKRLLKCARREIHPLATVRLNDDFHYPANGWVSRPGNGFAWLSEYGSNQCAVIDCARRRICPQYRILLRYNMCVQLRGAQSVWLLLVNVGLVRGACGPRAPHIFPRSRTLTANASTAFVCV